MSKNCITKEWKEIEKSILTDEQIQLIKNRLTIENPAYKKALKYQRATPEGMEPYITLFREDADKIYVPRNWSNKTLKPIKQYNKSLVRWPDTKWELRDYQYAPYDELMVEKDGLICLPCGTGKSIITLFAARSIGQRTLVISPTKAVVKQWLDYFKDMFGDLPNGCKQLTSKDFLAADFLSSITLQQVALHPLPEWFTKQFGIVIYDEVDIANAAQLSKALPMFNCLRFGLTATKRREDQMDILSDLHIGPILFEMTRIEEAARPTIWIKNTGLFYNSAAPLPVSITAASKSPVKKEIIINYVQRALEKNRNIFVLCERIDQAEDYAATLEELFPGQIALAHSGTKTKDYTKPVIVATNLLGRGFNKEDLDTLLVTGIFIYSVREFRQLLGRLQRRSAGKKRLMVIVLQDNSGLLDHKLKKILFENKDLYTEVKWIR